MQCLNLTSRLRPARLPLLLFVLLPTGVVSAHAGELEQIQSSFDFMNSAKVSLNTKDRYSSPLKTKPDTKQWDVLCLRKDDWWGVDCLLASSADPGVFHRNSYYFRGDAGLRFYSKCNAERETIDEEDSLYGMLCDPKLSGSTREFDQWWPSGSVDLICFGVLDSKQICAPDGLLGHPKLGKGPGNLLVVTGESPNGRITLTCDPEHSYLPTMIVLEQTLDHYSKGRLIADIEMDGGGVWPSGKIKGSKWFITTRFDKGEVNDDQHFISAWKIVREYYCEAGVTVRQTTEGKVNSIEFGINPKPADFLLGLEVPRKKRILVIGAEKLRYIWDGEWAVPENINPR